MSASRADALDGQGVHGDVLGDHARALAAEVARRMEVEAALRASLEELRGTEARLQRAQRELLVVTNSLPTLVCHVDRALRYTFVNVAYERWFGVRSADLVGKHVSEVVGPDAFAVVAEHMRTALAGCEVTFEALIPYKLGGERFVEASYMPRLEADGTVVGFVGLIADISERKRLENARAATTQRAERLMKITGAIADAVTPEQVYEAIVDQVAAALGASSAALWRATEDGTAAILLRAVGYAPEAQRAFERLDFDAERRAPATDALATGQPVWIDSQTELLSRYPHLRASVTLGREYRIACLPVEVHGRPVGALGFTFEAGASVDREDQAFLQLIAGYSGQALERLRLLEAEQHSRARAELLYRLAASANVAVNAEQVFEPALDAIGSALGAERAAVLAFDRDGVMRFRAWRGLSAEYRAAVEGHSPWSRDERAPEPIYVPDVECDPSFESFLPLFRGEGIASLGFIPLIASGRLIGKFMVYYDRPRSLAPHERAMANAIATHIASAVDRFAVLDQLQRTVRFNEMFTGMLGHDLRNPLGAIMTAAQLALSRVDNPRTIKPLTRIVTSGMRMARMIDQLLDFTRVRVGDGIPIDRKRCDLGALLYQAAGELEDAHPEVRIERECTGDCSGAWDSDRLLQVLSNLVANAVQHGVAEDGVRLRVNGTAPEHVDVLVHNVGVVPEHVLPRLFEPMAAGEHRRERSQGLGLGLYISREIVIAHGGTIDVQSSAAAGTTFTVSLPRAAPVTGESSRGARTSRA